MSNPTSPFYLTVNDLEEGSKIHMLNGYLHLVKVLSYSQCYC